MTQRTDTILDKIVARYSETVAAEKAQALLESG